MWKIYGKNQGNSAIIVTERIFWCEKSETLSMKSLHIRCWPGLPLNADKTISANKMANKLPNTDVLSQKSYNFL